MILFCINKSRLLTLYEKLKNDHEQEVQLYLSDPRSHPQHNQQWMEFINKRTESILSFGLIGPVQYDFADAFKVTS